MSTKRKNLHKKPKTSSKNVQPQSTSEWVSASRRKQKKASVALAAVLAVLLVVSLVAPLVTPGTPNQPIEVPATSVPITDTSTEVSPERSEAIAYYETLTGEDVFGEAATLVDATTAAPVSGNVRLFIDNNEAAVTVALNLGVNLRYVGEEFSVLEISGELLPEAVAKLGENGAQKIAQQPA